MFDMFRELSSLNPDPRFIEDWRTVNTVLGAIGFVVVLAFKGVERWPEWSVRTKLRYLALVMFVFTGTYGTYEVNNLNTYFRVPMVTVCLFWVIISSFWPEDKPSRKRD